MISHVSVESVVKESVKKHSKSFIAKNIRLTLGDISSEVTTDKKWMGFILDQLIGNAVKYTGPGGVIKIWLERDANEQRLHIEDTGVGIAPEDLGRVFQRSFTGTNGRIAGSTATGMGLYLSLKLAKKLGHNITMVSDVGKGTRVTIHFPKWTDYFDVADEI